MNSSLNALQILLPFLHMIEEVDVEYIMSREARCTWFENLDKRPLRVRNQKVGQTGLLEEVSMSQSVLSRGLRRAASVFRTMLLKH
jgi:hypothetical protein